MNEGFSVTVSKKEGVKICWYLSPEKINLVSHFFNKSSSSFMTFLRIYPIINQRFGENQASSFYEKKLCEGQNTYLSHELIEEKPCIFEVGIKLDGEKWFPLLRSSMKNITTEQGTALSAGEITFVLSRKNRSPGWAERVSTYSFYENINDGWKTE